MRWQRADGARSALPSLQRPQDGEGMNRIPVHQAMMIPESERAALDAAINSLAKNLTETIINRVREGADPLIDSGYKLDELVICDWGDSIYVEPRSDVKVSRLRLWFRRSLIRLRLRGRPIHDYALIEVSDYDTRRLISGLAIFRGGKP